MALRESINTILLISYHEPSLGHAGGVRLLDIYRVIKESVPKVELSLLTVQENKPSWKTSDIESLFDTVYRLDKENFTFEQISELGIFEIEFDVIDFQYHQSGRLLRQIRKSQPKAKLLFSPMESMQRTFWLGLSHILSLGWKQMLINFYHGLEELLFALQANKIIFVTEADRLCYPFFRKKTCTIDTCVSLDIEHNTNPYLKIETSTPKLLYIAFFGSRTNRDAILWFITRVHPLIINAIPDYELDLIGSGGDADFQASLDVAGVNFIGESEDLTCFLSQDYVGIIPVLHGAGIRGKVHQYSISGIPSVASPTAVKGLKYVDRESIYLSSNVDDFAVRCIELLRDKELRKKVGLEAYNVCKNNYTWEALKMDISKTYELTPND